MWDRSKVNEGSVYLFAMSTSQVPLALLREPKVVALTQLLNHGRLMQLDVDRVGSFGV